MQYIADNKHNRYKGYMATMKQYEDREKAIDQAWQAIKPVGAGWSYITDQNVDSENCAHCEYNSPEYWDSMLASLDISVATRLEDMGISWSSFPIALNY
jgi:hypothetical protein